MAQVRAVKAWRLEFRFLEPMSKAWWTWQAWCKQPGRRSWDSENTLTNQPIKVWKAKRWRRQLTSVLDLHMHAQMCAYTCKQANTVTPHSVCMSLCFLSWYPCVRRHAFTCVCGHTVTVAFVGRHSHIFSEDLEAMRCLYCSMAG